MDPATISALVVSILTALGIMADRMSRHWKKIKLKSPCIDVHLQSTNSPASSQTVSTPTPQRGSLETRKSVERKSVDMHINQIANNDIIIEEVIKRMSEIGDKQPTIIAY